jgi:hypothetical protein
MTNANDDPANQQVNGGSSFYVLGAAGAGNRSNTMPLYYMRLCSKD